MNKQVKQLYAIKIKRLRKLYKTAHAHRAKKNRIYRLMCSVFLFKGNMLIMIMMKIEQKRCVRRLKVPINRNIITKCLFIAKYFKVEEKNMYILTSKGLLFHLFHPFPLLVSANIVIIIMLSNEMKKVFADKLKINCGKRDVDNRMNRKFLFLLTILLTQSQQQQQKMIHNIHFIAEYKVNVVVILIPPHIHIYRYRHMNQHNIHMLIHHTDTQHT